MPFGWIMLHNVFLLQRWYMPHGRTMSDSILVTKVVYASWVDHVTQYSCYTGSIIVGILADQNRPKNGGTQQISEILHIENWIVCCIQTYVI